MARPGQPEQGHLGHGHGTADYAPTMPPASHGGVVARVDAGSPAWEAGIRAGMTLTSAQGHPLRDAIDWEWLADGPSVEVEGTAPVSLLGESEGAFDEEDLAGGTVEFSCLIERDAGQAWGIAFADPLFDQVITCKNRCTFCFMHMLPPGMRPTLYLRDDDYRLSFLQGNFVTLTNMSADDVSRVIACGLSPLHLSLHAVTPAVREELIGPRQARGLEVADELLAAGVELHAQVVLVPGANDGDELERTLAWVEARPGVLSCGIVPLGFTRFQRRYSRGFNDPDAARRVIGQVAPHQERSRRRLGVTRFHLSDEFYLNAQVDPPPAKLYDGYPQYEDGIGMLRSFLDAWGATSDRQRSLAEAIRRQAQAGHKLPVIASGAAFCRFFAPVLAASPLDGLVRVVPVENRFFGGNVDVAGLLVAADVVATLERAPAGPVLLPGVMLNADGITLDGWTPDRIAHAAGRRTRMVSCTVEGLLDGLGWACADA